MKKEKNALLSDEKSWTVEFRSWLSNTSKKNEEFKECPVCEKKTFEYDHKLGANCCRNEFCGWRDKVAPAIDVPMWFLDYAYQKAEHGPRQELIKKIIEATKKRNREVGLEL